METRYGRNKNIHFFFIASATNISSFGFGKMFVCTLLSTQKKIMYIFLLLLLFQTNPLDSHMPGMTRGASQAVIDQNTLPHKYTRVNQSFY